MAKTKKAAAGRKGKASAARTKTKATAKPGARKPGRPRKVAPRRSAGPLDAAGPGHRAKPFVKWAGGKRQLLREIERHIPKTGIGTYHEPFLGGGAVFFSLPLGTKAYLSDSNERLVRTYQGIQKNVERVIALLKGYPHDRTFFEEMRGRDIDRATDVEVAAWFIYLNKTGFNGLYRVNSKNKFNVPFGRYKNIRYLNEANLKACADSLKTAEIEHQDFEKALKKVVRGDFVYLDPPYVPLSTTSNFTSYTAGRFTHADQERLRDAVRGLKERGAQILLSNSSSAAHLYDEEGFETIEVLASRTVNSKSSGRGKIKELLIK